MFIYIVINEINYPIGTFVDIIEARKYKENNINSKIIKSTLVGNLPTVGQSLKDKMGLGNIKKAQENLPDEYKKMFGMKI